MTPAHDLPPSGAARDGTEGFTLVEVLVGFAVAAFGTLLAMQIAGTAMDGARRTASARIAADEAEAVVLRRMTEGPLSPGLVQGFFSDGKPWTLAVEDVRRLLGVAGAPPVWRLRVTAGDASGRLLHSTLMPDAASAN